MLIHFQVVNLIREKNYTQGKYLPGKQVYHTKSKELVSKNENLTDKSQFSSGSNEYFSIQTDNQVYSYLYIPLPLPYSSRYILCQHFYFLLSHEECFELIKKSQKSKKCIDNIPVRLFKSLSSYMVKSLKCTFIVKMTLSEATFRNHLEIERVAPV